MDEAEPTVSVGSVVLKAAASYFGVVFGTGFVLGIARVLFLVPLVGTRYAELIEAPVMLGVTILSARWVVKHFHVPSRLRYRLCVGVIAFTLMLLFEFSLVLYVRGLTLTDYIGQRDPISSSVYYGLLIVFAVMPALVRRQAI